MLFLKMLIVACFMAPSSYMLWRYLKTEGEKPQKGAVTGIVLATAAAGGFVVFLMVRNIFF